MKLGAVALLLCLLAAAVWLGLSITTSESSGGGSGGSKVCAPTALPKAEVSLCSNLEVVYEELGDISCKIVPKCKKFREKITTFAAPMVKFPGALDNAFYVLLMVDPDAPSRADPRMKYWRHWVVANIKGSNLKTGNIQGTVVTDYQPPTPPPTTGLHRYQFFLFLQGPQAIAIPFKENRNRGAWKMEKFKRDHGLPDPIASTQFMTEFDGALPPDFSRMDQAKGEFSER